MSKPYNPVLTVGAPAAAALTANRFVTYAGAVPAAGAGGCGVARSDAAIGERVPIDVLGIVTIETGGAISANALVETDNQGRAITRNTGVVLARLTHGQSATGAGQFVEAILIPN
ncbi:MAG: hypothetical protein PWP40_2115 [Rhodocyclaceae bacterium]|nr:hypothetical protein [Rhodocyclaceae bacterium]